MTSLPQPGYLSLSLPPMAGWMEIAAAMLLAFVLLSLATSILRFEYLTKVRADSEAKRPVAREAFPLQVAERLGPALRQEQPLLILLFRIADLPEDGSPSAIEVRRKVEERCQSLLRGKDMVCPHLKDLIGVVAEAPRRFAPRLVQRLREGCTDLLPPGAAIRSGVSSFPEDGQRTADLLSEALRSLSEARPVSDVSVPAEADDVMEEDADVDPLTGVIRSERIEVEARKYLAAFRREGVPVAFLMLAVDAVDAYAAQYGQEAVAELIRGVSRTLRRSLRDGDLVGRCDLSSFLLLLPCHTDHALRVARRLAAEIRKQEVRCEAGVLRSTVCIGVACCPLHEQRPGSLFHLAREALQRAQSRCHGLCLLYDPAWKRGHHTKPRRERF